jgi:lipoate synthase
LQGWAHNFKNVASQKQNAICKPRAQYENTIALLKRIAPQQLMITKVSQKFCQAQRTQAQLF